LRHKGAVDAEIILVDNASTESDPSEFLKEFPTIKMVKSYRNGGFAYGNNLGIQHSSGEYILLLNNDTIITENSFERCLEFMKHKPLTGVLGCRMTYPDGRIQYTARRFRSVSWELLDLFRFIPYLMPYPKRAKRMLGKYFRHDQDMECDWLNGAFFLFPSKILNELPGKKLDDRFFMYGEDQLWSEQIKKLGYSNYFFAGTTIIHISSGSTAISKQLALRRTMMKHELIIMKERKGSGLYYFLFKCIFVAKEGTRNFLKRVIFALTGKLLR
jgi:GT2 family glycosyltransferase